MRTLELELREQIVRLDGLEGILQSRWPPRTRAVHKAKVHLVRYCDDFIITGSSRELLETEVLPLVEAVTVQATALRASGSDDGGSERQAGEMSISEARCACSRLSLEGGSR
jgi:hypothetical protein